jgi:PDZ domain-containing protein
MTAARTVMPATESARVTDTPTSTLSVDDQPDGPPPARHETEREAAARAGLTTRAGARSWWAVTLVACSVLVLVAIAVAAILPSGWFAEKENRRLGVAQPAAYARTPASAQPVDDLIRVGDLEGKAEQFPPNGDIYFVTVMAPQQSLLSWLVGRNEPAIEFLTAEDVNGFRTPSQRRTLDLASMRTSEQVAQYVALKKIGYDVSIVPGDVLIEDMVCLEPSDDGRECDTWSPSDAVLDPGDRILAIDDEPIGTVDDLSAILDEKQPGDVVTMTIKRPEQGELEVDVELTASPDDPERTIVGFYPFDTATVELPFELSIDTQSIGGPSAGLAFTLTLIDELTEGELTPPGGVAVTGTMSLDGTVGAIGGLRQKASAVAQTGVDVFLVPAAQGEADIAAAQRAAGDDLTIIPVSNLDEALAALRELGGDPLPS